MRRPVVAENSGNPVILVLVPFPLITTIVVPAQMIADPSGVMIMSSRHRYSVCPIPAVLAGVTAGWLAASRLPPPLLVSSSRTLPVWPTDQLNASVCWLAGQDSDLVARRPPMVPPLADQIRAAPPWTGYSLTCWTPPPGAIAIASVVASGDRARPVIVRTSATDMGSRAGVPGRPEALSRTW